VKRCYFVYDYDPSEGGIALVSSSVREARSWGWKKGPWMPEHFFDIRARWLRNVDVSDKPIGYEFPYEEGVLRGAYLNEAEI